MRLIIALCLTLIGGIPALASAKTPQIPGCASVNYFHGAKKPNRVAPKPDGATWLTWANNSLPVPKRSYSIDELAKRFEQTPAEMRTTLCGDSGKDCSSRLIAADNDGFADTYALAIRIRARSGAEVRYWLQDKACVDWEKERVATSCDMSSEPGDLVALTYSTSGVDDEGNAIMWQQLFDGATGALLLTVQSPDQMAEIPSIRIGKDDTVAVVGCGQWPTKAVRAGKLPTSGDSKAARTLIAAGRKATKTKNYAEAVTAFTSAIKLKPDAVKAWSGRGYAHLRAGRAKAALSDFNHLLKTYRAIMDDKTIKMVEHNIANAKKLLKKVR